jgi:hypothetical protein
MLQDAVRFKDEAPASFRRMLTTIRSLGHTVRRLRVNNDTLFLGAAFRNLLDEFNIRRGDHCPLRALATWPD